MMSKPVSDNFTEDEVTCNCGCGTIVICKKTVDMMQDIRDHFNKRVNVHRWTSCEKHNVEVGGAKKSKHLIGIAVDFDVEDTPLQAVFAYIDKKYGDVVGLAMGRSFIHVDTRGYHARWTYS